MGLGKISIAWIYIAQISIAQITIAQISIAQISIAQISIAQIAIAQNSIAPLVPTRYCGSNNEYSYLVMDCNFIFWAKVISKF